MMKDKLQYEKFKSDLKKLLDDNNVTLYAEGDYGEEIHLIYAIKQGVFDGIVLTDDNDKWIIK